MELADRTLSGVSYLECVTALLQRVRAAHPTTGVWEAADLQWWWRKPRDTDNWKQQFWFDSQGEPVAAAVATDWGGWTGLDIVSLPSLEPEAVRFVWQHGLDAVSPVTASPLEVMIDDNNTVMISLLARAGFAAMPGTGTSAWMSAASKPAVAPLAAGYTLKCRTQMHGIAHHMTARNGPRVEERLRQTSLYRPDLDLAVVDPSGAPVAYGLFWYDPTTKVGLVEPMRTVEGHRRMGFARHILTSGIHRLVEAGATRVKISYENDNVGSQTLYLDAGFVPMMSTSVYARQQQP